MISGLGIALLTFALMETKAWLTHKYVLHGFLWKLHRSHHTLQKSWFEWNDLVFLYYAFIAMFCFIYGAEKMDYRFWIGVGISLYGVIYFIVHDLFIHRRLKIFGKTSNAYFMALDMAHKMHHKSKGRDDSESFGMLWVHPKYFRMARQKVSCKNK